MIGHETRTAGGIHAVLLAGSVRWPTAHARHLTPLRELSSRAPRRPPQDSPRATAHRERPPEQAKRQGQEHRQTGRACPRECYTGSKEGNHSVVDTHSWITEDCKGR